MGNELMEKRIEYAREQALKQLGVSDELMNKGLELHRELFTCDAFGFLPSTLSALNKRAIKKMLDGNATYAEVAHVYDQVRKTSHTNDAKCAEEYSKILNAANLNCVISTVGSEKSLHHSLHRISWYIQIFDKSSDLLGKATCVDDIKRINNQGKMAVVCSVNCPPAHGGLNDGPDAHYWIDIFHRLGIRVMHLTYNRRNWVGDGCLEPADGGLSLHGIDVVRHLNQIGIVVDTAHSGKQTTIEAAKKSKASIMATHSSCQAIYNHPRGKSDDELKAIADTNGVFGVYGINKFLGPDAGIRNFLEHIDYAVNLIGPDHVTIGTDRCFTTQAAQGGPEIFGKSYPTASIYSADRWYGAWDTTPDNPISDVNNNSLHWTNWPIFTVGLLSLGYDKEIISKILGKNVLRVLRNVEQTSEESI